MRANIIVCLLAAGFLGCLTALNSRSRIPSQEKLATQIEAPSNEVMGPEAYKGSRVGFCRSSYPLRVSLDKASWLHDQPNNNLVSDDSTQR